MASDSMDGAEMNVERMEDGGIYFFGLDMECNKDEAVRAKDIAEKKYASMDFEGAKRFALKAQALFPTLEGITQMITTFSIYLASMVKIAGEKDWYSILSVPMSVDDQALKKQYREMLLQTHPDKNKSVGADGAFHLVQEAYKVLSDKQRRAQYDQKILPHLTPQPRKTSASPGVARKFYNFAANNAAASTAGSSNQMAGAAASTVRQVQPQPTHHKRAPVQSPGKDLVTFWTSCNRCYMQYEYYRQYLNLNLRCAGCNQAFLATEIVIPATERAKTTSVGTTKKMKKTMAEGPAVGSSSSA
ncbi:J domain-containing protein DDB_G0295729 [Setaria italica]|nr:J domain-containing protein DDB_G0295729 [Setaria italica]